MELVTRYLVSDHRHLEDLLARAAAPVDLDLAAFAELRAGLLRHIAVEEKLLLGTVRRIPGGLAPEDAHRLRIEHAALTSLLVPTPDRALLGEIERLLRDHAGREEGATGVFARCELILGAKASSALAKRARAYPRVPLAPHFDGQGVVRTAREALASASRLSPPRVAVVS